MDPNQQSGKELLSSLKEALRTQGDFRDILKESIKELDKTLGSYDKILARVATLNKDTVNTKEINSAIKRTIESRYTNEEKLADLQKKLNETQQKQAETYLLANNRIAELETKKLELNIKNKKKREDAIRDIETEILQNEQLKKNGEERLNIDQLVFTEAKKKKDLDDKALEILGKELIEEKKIEKSIGSAGALAKIFGQNLNVGEETYGKMVEKARELEKTNASFKSLKVLIFGAKTAIKEGLKDPLIGVGMVMKANNAIFSGLKSVFGFIVNITKKVLDIITGWNGKIFEFGKNLGVGERDSRRMMNHFLNMSNASGPLLIRTSKLAEAFTSMTESLGFMAPMNSEMLTTATLLQRQFGFTAEHIQSINELQALSGKSFKETYDTVNGVSKAEGGRLKFMMTERQVMGEISKVSSLVLLNFKGNIPALTSAVVQSKKLGMSLNEVAATTNGFLDFESSISKEFEAQLLTGKDLNLQTLRRLALNHDTKGMMDEIGKRIPSMLAFEKMNTIERQSYAEAMNMSEESMAEIIKKQEINNKLGTQGAADGAAAYEMLKKRGLTHSEIIQKMKEEGAQTYATQSITERWNALIERIQDTIGQMAEGPLGKIVNQFITIISKAGFFEKVMVKIKSVIGSIAEFFKDLPGRIQQMLKISAIVMGTIAAFQTAAAIALFPTNPAAAIAMGIGAAKMATAAVAAGYAAKTVGQMKSSFTPIANTVQESVLKEKQISTAPAGNTTGAQSNANIHSKPTIIQVNSKTQIGERVIAETSSTNLLSFGIGDNTQNSVQNPHNIGNPGQSTA
jgi:hypothetical protein